MSLPALCWPTTLSATVGGLCVMIQSLHSHIKATINDGHHLCNQSTWLRPAVTSVERSGALMKGWSVQPCPQCPPHPTSPPPPPAPSPPSSLTPLPSTPHKAASVLQSLYTCPKSCSNSLCSQLPEVLPTVAAAHCFASAPPATHASNHHSTIKLSQYVRVYAPAQPSACTAFVCRDGAGGGGGGCVYIACTAFVCRGGAWRVLCKRGLCMRCLCFARDLHVAISWSGQYAR